MRRQYPPFVTGVIALFACAAVAKATPLMSLSVGGTVLPSVSGMVTDTVASGTFNGSVFTAFGFPLAGSIQEPQIELNGIVKASGAGTLVLKITQTNNESTAPDWVFDNEFGDTLKTKGLTIFYATYIDVTDAAFGMGTPLTSGSFSSTGSLSDMENAMIAGSLFSFTEIITLQSSHASSLLTSFDASLSGVAIPEPSSLALLGLGLVGLGLIYRKRKLV